MGRRSGTVAGSLCLDCEDEWLTPETVTSMATCFACDEPADLLFPKWDSIVESDDGSGPVETEYKICLTTPAACHYCIQR
ncbi:hypothetical protein [Salarchaeum japonicum]|uniref:hypothetical protein n=1 Tax=Salarchaeum japonicum TaxID=555573 RepID=UPI001D0AF912|nr:hypothetical protein [Salarchaeum japonicum]